MEKIYISSYRTTPEGDIIGVKGALKSFTGLKPADWLIYRGVIFQAGTLRDLARTFDPDNQMIIYPGKRTLYDLGDRRGERREDVPGLWISERGTQSRAFIAHREPIPVKHVRPEPIEIILGHAPEKDTAPDKWLNLPVVHEAQKGRGHLWGNVGQDGYRAHYDRSKPAYNGEQRAAYGFIMENIERGRCWGSFVQYAPADLLKLIRLCKTAAKLRAVLILRVNGTIQAEYKGDDASESVELTESCHAGKNRTFFIRPDFLLDALSGFKGDDDHPIVMTFSPIDNASFTSPLCFNCGDRTALIMPRKSDSPDSFSYKKGV